ncbi:unnamed protein product [Trichogramma brassicae]|uniref:Glucose-methanol-choline oxidoreductase C-terminal domain-containing protein n=1 Tax=Trichogramma brassicae TaxID=86971 RepID=A0A6H5HW35_9HYME|nr:unnamed protein product [Trichogramma brassicae]
MKKLGLTLTSSPLSECADFPFKSDEYWTCAIRQETRTENHQAGSCKMGPATDEMSVVDPRLRVHGIERVRVVDASVMPRLKQDDTSSCTKRYSDLKHLSMNRSWQEYTRIHGRGSIHSQFCLCEYIPTRAIASMVQKRFFKKKGSWNPEVPFIMRRRRRRAANVVIRARCTRQAMHLKREERDEKNTLRCRGNESKRRYASLCHSHYSSIPKKLCIEGDIQCKSRATVLERHNLHTKTNHCSHQTRPKAHQLHWPLYNRLQQAYEAREDGTFISMARAHIIHILRSASCMRAGSKRVVLSLCTLHCGRFLFDCAARQEDRVSSCTRTRARASVSSSVIHMPRTHGTTAIIQPGAEAKRLAPAVRRSVYRLVIGEGELDRIMDARTRQPPDLANIPAYVLLSSSYLYDKSYELCSVMQTNVQLRCCCYTCTLLLLLLADSVQLAASDFTLGSYVQQKLINERIDVWFDHIACCLVAAAKRTAAPAAAAARDQRAEPSRALRSNC